MEQQVGKLRITNPCRTGLSAVEKKKREGEEGRREYGNGRLICEGKPEICKST